MKLLFMLFLFLSVQLFCFDKNSAEEIVIQALKIVKEHSINSSKLNWDLIKREAIKIKSDDDLCNVLQMLIDQLKDNHSYLIKADGKRWLTIKNDKKKDSEIIIPYEKLKDNNIAYILVNPMSSTNDLDKDEYAQKLYDRIYSSYKSDMNGWILDFRENSGGQLWPMLAGLSPLINSDTAGYGVYPKFSWIWWAKNGQAGVGANAHYQIKNRSKKILKKRPIAILIGNKTASSGERTRGLATINQPYKLDNGIVMMLTSGYFGDRDKKIYSKGIEPDIKITGDICSEDDSYIEYAIKRLIK